MGLGNGDAYRGKRAGGLAAMKESHKTRLANRPSHFSGLIR